MKKKLITTSVALMITFSGMSIPTLNITTNHAAAATTAIPNPYNNQAAVDAKADQIIATAKYLIGKAEYGPKKTTYPYSFACATFINYVFGQNGVDIATETEEYMMEQGYEVPRDQLQKGDLVFFDANPTNTDPTDHVGIYIGDNKIIHMANPELDVTISDLDSTSYYRNNYVKAKRVLPSLLSANPATKGDQVVSGYFALKDKVKINSTTNNAATSTFTNGGLVDHIYKQAGINLGTTNMSEQMKLGQPVSKDNLKKGDLVFFNNTTGSTTPALVGIYGGDHRLLLASTAYGTVTRILFLPYYNDLHYITARRVITETPVTTTPTTTPATTTTTTPAPTTTAPTPAPAVTTKADSIVSSATNLIGKANFGYVYDASTLTFTPGGFTKYVYNLHGINLKSTLAGYQATLGLPVEKANLQKGDLIFFGGTSISNVGIYAGDNQFIHLIKGKGTIKENLNSDWATQNYKTARRVL
ncbi:cell wall-associated NlpC family hydrolase [Neobacillus niacini]|uniref:C40 family peptidase n=1 Tax=Neobacillus driksii TaxID=3035913 RepID=UPI002783BD4C|nr:NlpC/P60 family protein [Neobacillus niacini]MDQ0973061.1 cell wall-associated NlpC family hydrolase [Neobacillus niacini]